MIILLVEKDRKKIDNGVISIVVLYMEENV